MYIYILFNRKLIFDTPEEDPNYNPLPEERPGGFAWGEGQRLGGWDPANIFDERLGKQTSLENGSVLLCIKEVLRTLNMQNIFSKMKKKIWSKDILQKNWLQTLLETFTLICLEMNDPSQGKLEMHILVFFSSCVKRNICKALLVLFHTGLGNYRRWIKLFILFFLFH